MTKIIQNYHNLILFDIFHIIWLLKRLSIYNRKCKRKLKNRAKGSTKNAVKKQILFSYCYILRATKPVWPPAPLLDLSINTIFSLLFWNKIPNLIWPDSVPKLRNKFFYSIIHPSLCNIIFFMKKFLNTIRDGE